MKRSLKRTGPAREISLVRAGNDDRQRQRTRRTFGTIGSAIWFLPRVLAFPFRWVWENDSEVPRPSGRRDFGYLKGRPNRRDVANQRRLRFVAKS